MNIYEKKSLGEILRNSSYPGRGIVCGKSGGDAKAVIAYFITGRSRNSRNRVFSERNGDIYTEPFDASKVEDPSLIIYRAVAQIGDNLIVTNGDQTDTICDFISEGKTFEEALQTRRFEPDSPNFTPRISASVSFEGGNFTYKMSILKSMDREGNRCARYFYSYEPEAGLGHFIHTYAGNEEPLPTFCGEPMRIEIPAGIDEFTDLLWENLNEENKISLYVRYVDISSGEYESRLINKNSQGRISMQTRNRESK